MARALQAMGRDFGGATPKQGAPLSVVKPVGGLRPGDVHLGDLDTGVQIGLSLAKMVEGRLLIQGVSRTGKSWTLRRLLEQTSGEIQQIVLDPEGEFRYLADELEMLHLDAAKLDLSTLAIAAARVREHRTSVILDLCNLDLEGQMKAATAFIEALIAVPEELWHPALVLIDEAQRFAPHGGYSETPAVKKASVAAVTDLMTRGRKRGLGAVLATHRLAQLAKSVGHPVLNFMVGLNTLDLDIKRAAETIGWSARRAFDRLPMLSAGEFVAVGPAFSLSPTVLKVGPVQTRHLGATPRMTAAPRLGRAAARKLLNLDDLLATAAADQAVLEETAKAPGLRQVRAFIRDLSFPLAGQIFGELTALAPDGAGLADLAAHLKRSEVEIADALALLDQYGAVEFSGDEPQRAVRVARKFMS